MCTVYCALCTAHARTCTCTVRRSTTCAQVTFTDRTEEFAVVAICGHDAAASAAAAMTAESGMPRRARTQDAQSASQAQCYSHARALPRTGAAWADARSRISGLEALGYRQLVPRGSLAAAASVLPPAAPAELHGLLSALLGVPDGAADMPSGECVPHESNLELLGSAAWSKCPPLAVPQLGSCASSGRAWRRWAARRSYTEAGPLSAQPLPLVLE